jgi:hypothetical protein
MVKRPDPLESTPPAFGEQAARQILREGFGVESLSLKPLAGERDQNFRVDTAAGQRFLFKISNPADDRPILAMQAAALRHIERVDPLTGNSRTPSSPPIESSAAATCRSACVSTPPVIARVSTMAMPSLFSG